MIQEIVLSNIDDVMLMAKDYQYREDIDRYRSSYYYRGVPDANYDLTTSLRRNCDDAAPLLEGAILRNFTKYASIEDPTLESSVWKQMIVGQHHGLPTRLLDWTHSSLVALNFAATEADFGMLDKRDCAVWRIDMRELNKYLPQKYRDALDAEKHLSSLDEKVNSGKKTNKAVQEKNPETQRRKACQIDSRIVKSALEHTKSRQKGMLTQTSRTGLCKREFCLSKKAVFCPPRYSVT